MRSLLLVIFITLFSYGAKAQQGQFSMGARFSDTTVYTEAEVMPKYPDGVVAMINFIDANLQKTGDKGLVYVLFIVERDGSLSHIHAQKSPSDEAGKEAVRVVSLFKKWIPGQQNKKPARVGFVLPIRLK